MVAVIPQIGFKVWRKKTKDILGRNRKNNRKRHP